MTTKLMPIPEARERLESERADALAEIGRLEADREALAGSAARNPSAIPKLEKVETALADRRRVVERLDLLLAGLDREEEAERNQEEASRRAALEADEAEADARLADALQAVEQSLDDLVAAGQRALAIDGELRRIRVALGARNSPRSMDALLAERVNWRCHLELPSRAFDRPIGSLGRDPLPDTVRAFAQAYSRPGSADASPVTTDD